MNHFFTFGGRNLSLITSFDVAFITNIFGKNIVMVYWLGPVPDSAPINWTVLVNSLPRTINAVNEGLDFSQVVLNTDVSAGDTVTVSLTLPSLDFTANPVNNEVIDPAP